MSAPPWVASLLLLPPVLSCPLLFFSLSCTSSCTMSSTIWSPCKTCATPRTTKGVTTPTTSTPPLQFSDASQAERWCLDRFFSNDHRKRETVKKQFVQLGVHSSVPAAEVFSSPRTARLFQRFGLTPGLSFDLRTGWDLNDPARRAKMWSHMQHERSIVIAGSWSGHIARTSHMRWMMDMYRWQVVQGRFFVHQYSWKLFRNAGFCTVKSILVFYVDGWRTFVTNCEEIHSNLSKLSRSSHVA